MSETHQRVVVHRRFTLFERPPEAVWAGLTDPEALRAWLCNEASVDLRVGGAFEFSGDLVFGRGGGQHITALEPGRLLRFTWPLGSSEHDVAEVTWRLEPQLDFTRLVVDEALTFEGAGRPRRGWLAGSFPLTNTYLPQLAAYLELGFCPVRVDANTAAKELVIEMQLPGVSAQGAFAAVSEPEHLNAWLTDAVKIEPRKDGEFHFVPEGGSEVQRETVLEFEPGRCIATSSWPPPNGVIRYTVGAVGDDERPAVRIGFVQSGFADEGQLRGVSYRRQGSLLSLAYYLLRGVEKRSNREPDERVAEIDLAASPARVWRALTDSEELAAWFCEHADVDLEAGRYDFWGRYTPTAPDRDAGRCPVLAVEPERRLRYAWAAGRAPGWHYPGQARVELVLTPLDGGASTRLRVVRENEGNPTATGAQPDHFWWGALSHLRAWLEVGRCGPRFDYTWPCENGEFEVQAEVDAPREAVFQQLFSEYEGAPEPGSPESWTVRWGHAPGGGTRVLEVSPGRSFSVEYRFGARSSPQVLEYRVDEEGGRTRITMTQSGFVAGLNVQGVASGFFGGFFDLAWRLETGDAWPPPVAETQPGVAPGVSRYGVRVLSGGTGHAPVVSEPWEPADYVGVYEQLAIPGQTARVVEEAEGLWLESPLGRFDLVPRGRDRFSLRGLGSVEVRRDDQGRVRGLTLDFGAGALAFRRLAGGEAPRARTRLSQEELDRYAGRYRFPEQDVVLDVAPRGEGLTVKAGGSPRGLVLPTSERHAFCGLGFARRFEFHVGGDGGVHGVTVSGDQGVLPFHARAERIVPIEPAEPG